MPKETFNPKPAIEILKDRNSAVRNFFCEEDNWLSADGNTFVSKSAISRIFTQNHGTSLRRQRINLAVYNLLSFYAESKDKSVDDITTRLLDSKDLYMSRRVAEGFFVFAANYLPRYPKLNLAIWGEENNRNAYSLPVWEEPWLGEVMSKPNGARVLSKLRQSRSQEGFSRIKGEIDRSYWQLGNFLNYADVGESPYWLRAGNETRGFYNFTPAENLTGTLIWEKNKATFSEDEKREFVPNVLSPLWRVSLGPTPLFAEISDREGLYISRVKYVQALYLLGNALEMPDLYFGARVGRKMTEFKKT